MDSSRTTHAKLALPKLDFVREDYVALVERMPDRLEAFDKAWDRLQDPSYRALSPPDASAAAKWARGIWNLRIILARSHKWDDLVRSVYGSLTYHLDQFFQHEHERVLQEARNNLAPVTLI